MLQIPGTLGFGAAAIGNLYKAVPDVEAYAVIEAAWQAGLRYFDTAPHYGFGLSEKRLGQTLGELDPQASAVISSKVGRRLDPDLEGDLAADRQGFVSPEPFRSVFDYTYDAIMRSFEESQARLGRTRIDILYAHDIGRYAHGDAHEARMREFLNGGLPAMQALKEQGVVGAIGLGVNETAVCEEILGHADLDVILLAGRYTLLDQSAQKSLFPLCERRGVRIVAGAPFNSGILAKGVRQGRVAHFEYGEAPRAVIEKVAAIEDICEAYAVPLAAAALQFPLRHPVVDNVIPGIGSPCHLKKAVALMAHPIPEAFWTALHDKQLLNLST